MKKLLCLAALAIASPAQAAPVLVRATPASAVAPQRPVVAIPDDTLAYAAYVGGRCFAFIGDSGKIEAGRFMERQEPDLKALLFEAYYAGIQAARKQPPTKAQCAEALAKSQAELASFIR